MGGEGFLGSGVCSEAGWDWGGHCLFREEMDGDGKRW